jgi:ankyrin repeat protein
MAIQRRHSTTVGILLNEGADVTFKYADKRTALHYAIEIRDNIVVAMLLNRSADVNARDDHGETPLLFSLRRDHAIFDALIARGADVNAADVDGWTPLMEAAGGNNLRVVKILLDHGADAKARDKDGWTAHKQALLSGCDGIIAQIAHAAAL